MRGIWPSGWKASLPAVDGATTHGVDVQLARLPRDASHLVLSVGGNNALGSQHLLQTPVNSTVEALTLLGAARTEFEGNYRKAVAACGKQELPLAICTIYNGDFPGRHFQKPVITALTAFTDVMIRVGSEHGLAVLDLRQICNQPEVYANPTEPSSIGGAINPFPLLIGTPPQITGNRVGTACGTDAIPAQTAYRGDF